MSDRDATGSSESRLRGSAWYRLFRWLLARRFLAVIFGLLVVFAGLVTMPFELPGRLGASGRLPRSPIAVDALPNVTDNQQIVFTRWAGRSPADVEDQITYPLGTALLGMPGVETIRSSSMFGFSSIYVVFEDDVDFYWARSRILEKLASLPEGMLPAGVSPALGPDATALGQVLWYTLEVHDEQGRIAPGVFGLEELRELQDWEIRYALQSVQGVAEVASVGGFVREFQIDVDPDAMRTHGVTLAQIAGAVRGSSIDVGARTLEINGAEYVVRGLGQIEDAGDLETSVIAAHPGHTPVRVVDVARVHLGPGLRRGALDDAGAPAVGGVVTVRHGDDPSAVIADVQARIEEVEAGLRRREIAGGGEAHIEIVPFYDRTRLIGETLGTLWDALTQELLLTALVVLLLVGHVRSASVVGLTLPVAVLGTFGLMWLVGVGANVMSLAGIAIAIGTMVDVGIVFSESVLRRLRDTQVGSSDDRVDAIALGAAEVAPAVVTSLATTVLSFLPVFALQGAEGKLFGPLAVTKTFALLTTMVLGVVLLPVLIDAVFSRRRNDADQLEDAKSSAPSVSLEHARDLVFDFVIACVGVVGLSRGFGPAWIVLPCVAILRASRLAVPEAWRRPMTILANAALVVVGGWWLAAAWMPLGAGASVTMNFLFAGACVGVVTGALALYGKVYEPLLRWALHRPGLVLGVDAALVAFGILAWLGAPTTAPASAELTEMGEMSEMAEMAPPSWFERTFPGLPSDFMPTFDEGTFLYMPTTAQHASMGTAVELLGKLDASISQIPEVRRVVGKLGRAETPLDPAPISMFEVVVDYVPEYGEDADGHRIRNWRPEIRTPDDIWREVERAGDLVGLTGAPKLMPIETRIVMLQTGMRSSTGLKIQGPDLASIEKFALGVERVLREVPEIDRNTVLADRVVGKPYLEIHVDRDAISRYGLSIGQVLDTVEIAVGGRPSGARIDGRVRSPIRVRYPVESRNSVEALQEITVTGHDGATVPLEQLAEVRYARGPQMIRGEDTFLTAFVTFDPAEGVGPVEAVDAARRAIDQAQDEGSLERPPGVRERFAGTYEDVLRSQARLAVLLPVALSLIFALLYLQFRRMGTSLLVFTGVVLAAGGGFSLLWAYTQPTFLDGVLAGETSRVVFGASLREVFQVSPQAMTVAVWVGFLAVFGIATDDGVLMATYLHDEVDPLYEPGVEVDRGRLDDAVVRGAQRRVRACLMTTATTILALLPLLTGTGRGADLMLPMALPIVGGMIAALLTLITVPVIFGNVAWWTRSLRRVAD